MPFCSTAMTIKAKNESDFKIIKDWCELFSKTDKIDVCEPVNSIRDFCVTYGQLNIDMNETRKIFLDFARFCIKYKAADELRMNFWITFDDSGDEYSLLYILKDGKATEQTAYRDMDEFNRTPSEQDPIDDWDEYAEYSEPQEIKLSGEDKKRSSNTIRYYEKFDATQMILDAMEKYNIPYDENTLNEITVRDVYDILAGTYDKEIADARPKAEDFKGKNIVLSGFRSNKHVCQHAIKYLGGIEQNKVGPDTDYVVYNDKKEGSEGKPYRIALELNSKGQNIILVPFEDFVWLAY